MGVFVFGAGFELKELVVDDCLRHDGSFGIGVIKFNGMEDLGRMIKSQREAAIGIVNAMDFVDHGIGNELADHSAGLGIWLQGVCR